MERASSSVTTFPIIGKKSRRKYIVKVPDYVESCREEIERLIENNLKEVKENNEIVRGIKLLRKPVKLSRRVSKKRRLRLGRMKQVSRRCEELRQKYWNLLDGGSAELTDDDSAELTDDDSAELTDDDSAELTDDDSVELENEYSDKICDYLQEQLNVTFNLRYIFVTHKELGDVIFYYMMRGEEPDKSAQTIFRRLFNSHDNFIDESYSWIEISCYMLDWTACFSQFYKRLNNNRTALLYILYKIPQLLLNKQSHRLINSLREHLPYDMLHEAITNITDKNKQTCLFYIETSSSFVQLYKNHIEDLFDLLSIRNTKGQTALHVNTLHVTNTLAYIYTPDKRDTFLKLTSITNVNNERFSSLMRRIEDKEYVTSTGYAANIIIIYNTNNRPGAEEHAQTIYNACKSKYDRYDITLRKNLTEDRITTLIKINYWRHSLKIVILMSHGNVGTIDDCDGKPIKLSVIEEAMCSNNRMQGKPKMLITECCQIGDESATTPAYAPTHDDFCAVMSCVSGQPSNRGVFLGKLAKQIENSKEDTNIFKLVNGVSAEMDREKHPQTPIIMSTLKANFCPTDDWHEPK